MAQLVGNIAGPPGADADLPAGGTTGQVLTKASDTEGDFEWTSATSERGAKVFDSTDDPADDPENDVQPGDIWVNTAAAASAAP